MSFLTQNDIAAIQGIHNDEYTDPLQRLMMERAYLKSCKRICRDRVIWLTVNPKPGIPLSRLMKTVDSFVDRKICIKPIYSYEQRGETLKDIGEGFHVHILFHKSNELCPKKYSDYITNSFKSLVGNDKCIDIKFYPKAFHQDKLDYLNGKKWDEEKLPKLHIDQVWRKSHDLKTIYIK